MNRSDIILGQEAICPDGLGRVVALIRPSGDKAKVNQIQVKTYVNDRRCWWDVKNVELIDPRPVMVGVDFAYGLDETVYSEPGFINADPPYPEGTGSEVPLDNEALIQGLKDTLHRISLSSQNSMTSMHDLGKEARRALELYFGV
ncbi:MAG TPA: hypothetical protein VIG24_16305 [Acidimicrobiia bacterium]